MPINNNSVMSIKRILRGLNEFQTNYFTIHQELDSGKFSSRVSEKRKSDMRYPRVPLCPKLADIENR